MTPIVIKILAGTVIGFAGTSGLLYLRMRHKRKVEEAIIEDIINSTTSSNTQPPF